MGATAQKHLQENNNKKATKNKNKKATKNKDKNNNIGQYPKAAKTMGDS